MAKYYYKHGMGFSEGCVCWKKYLGWVAHAKDGKVDKFNEEHNLSDEDKKQIEDFVALADKAPRDTFGY